MIPVREGEHNEELRYALRSIAAHVPHRTIWLAGHRPSWVRGVGHIPVPQVAGRKWANTRANRAAACQHPEVAERFVLWNDDMFALQPVGEIPVWHRGPVTAVIGDYRQNGQVGWTRNPYLSGLLSTLTWLRARGHDEPLSYELHVPLPVHKTLFADTLRLAETLGVEAPHIRTLYGNLHQLGGTEIGDVKIMDRATLPPANAVFVSTSDHVFNHGAVGQWIRRRLPQPCRYEQPTD